MEEKKQKLMQEVTSDSVFKTSKKKSFNFEKSLLDDAASVTHVDFSEHDFLAGMSP